MVRFLCCAALIQDLSEMFRTGASLPVIWRTCFGARAPPINTEPRLFDLPILAW